MAHVHWHTSRETGSAPDVFRRLFDSGNKLIHSLGIINFLPVADISEDEVNVYIHIELPGLTKDDVKVTVSEDNMLTVRGEKKREAKKVDENYSHMERSFGTFVRVLELPATVKTDAIDATFENGVLDITLPKIVPSKPKVREIPIA